jgi:exodeoxyribonuclease VII large subunit
MDNDQRLTLYELNSLVRRCIDVLLPDEYWVEAEVSELRTSPQGHCYMELVQKDSAGNTPVARAKANCWHNTWNVLGRQFLQATGQWLGAGMKVLLKVRANFHEAFGFSWIVVGIDPYFTLGDMARRRKEILAKLKAEGIIDLNKQLPLPPFAQSIAVISSETAAGYGDFCRQLADNEYGFCFSTHLFTAAMQGERVEQSVIAALNSIYAEADRHDCVVIIRGGGATSDLSGFDSLALAENVANFPLPIITGIGHDRDESVIDFVSHTRVKTPTAAAALLIDNLKAVANKIDKAEQTIRQRARARMDLEKLRLANADRRLPTLFTVVKLRQEAKLDQALSRTANAIERTMTQQAHKLERLADSLNESTRSRLTQESHRLEMLQQRTHALNPQTQLNRGYSITLHEGKAVYDSASLKQGDKLTTRLAKGTVSSTVD